MEIGLGGLCGNHRFRYDQSLESVVTLEDIWMLNRKPGPQSLNFSDAGVIMKPFHVQNEKPLCRYCFSPYDPEENKSGSCPRHANEWDEEGYFGPSLAMNAGKHNGNGEGQRPLCEWTCCGGSNFHSPKCSARRHTSSANMIQVTSVTIKPMLVGGSTVVNVFKELQVSLFPEAKHTVVVQLTSDIFGFLSGYFFPSRSVINAQLLGGHQAGAASSFASSGGGAESTGASGAQETTQDSSSDEEQDEDARPNGPNSVGSTGESCVYLKYCRIGAVDLELTTVGFPKKYGVALDRGLTLSAPSFQRSERIVSWKQLLQKYIKHLVKSFVRGQSKQNASATSSLESLFPTAAASSAKAAGSSLVSAVSGAAASNTSLKGSATSSKGREQREALLFGKR